MTEVEIRMTAQNALRLILTLTCLRILIQMLNFFYCSDDDSNLPSDRPELTIDHGAGVLFPD